MAYKKTGGVAKTPSDKYSAYVEGYNEKVLALVQENKAPWQVPWNPGEAGPGGMPYNATSGKAYTGSNSMYLSMQQIMNGYNDERWLTFNQGNGLGANVRKGEKGTQLVKWVEADEKKAGAKEGDAKSSRMFPVLFTVFNASQFDGLAPSPERVPLSEPERHEKCEQLIKDSGVQVNYNGGNRAFYRPSTDSVHLPERSQFPTADNFYAVALHEISHGSGHPSRLNRDLTGKFGSVEYAHEELRAEIASMMIGRELQVGHDPSQHAAYVQHWVQNIKDDPKAILNACRDAEKICQFLGVEKYVQQPTLALENANEAKAENTMTPRTRAQDEWAPSVVQAAKQPVHEQRRDFGMAM